MGGQIIWPAVSCNVMAMPDLTHAVFPLSIDGLGEVRISVSRSDAETAVRIIREQGARPAPGK